ncbi:RICIN domain-containing protein [Streptomyces decoyicus]|uniref:RICIN domain-containing protein n=1 Tax=Streptomyces decoyicus TaxID=249567 RepID=UPI00380C7B26
MASATAMALMWTAMGMPGWADTTGGSQSAAEAAASVKTAPIGAVACEGGKYGDGKVRYQPVYVYRAETGPRKNGPATVRNAVWDVDQIFEASAMRYPGFDASRRPRIAQDAKCQPKVMSVAVKGLGAKHAMADVRERAREAVRAQIGKGAEEWLGAHRMLLFYDTGEPDGCGTAATPTPDMRADKHGGWSEVSWGCAGADAMTHEMIHSFGVSHCDENKAQGNDPICRGYDSTPRCTGPRSGSVLDCERDDFHYFHPRPAKGSHLAKNPKQNVANSPYLIRNKPAKPVAMRLADATSGKCLAPARGGDRLRLAKCGGDDQTWLRKINSRGYFTFKLGEKCLAKGKDGGAMLAKCANTARQDWWQNESEGDARNGYALVHSSDGQRITVDKASVFVMRKG